MASPSLLHYYEQYYQVALQRFLLLNYLSATTSTSTTAPTPLTSRQAFDLERLMQQLFPVQDPQARDHANAVVYQVEPVLSLENEQYWDNTNDLSVSENLFNL